MAVGVDHAGDQHLAGQVDDLRAALVGLGALVIADVDDLAVLHRHGGDIGHLTVHGVNMAVFKHSNHNENSPYRIRLIGIASAAEKKQPLLFGPGAHKRPRARETA